MGSIETEQNKAREGESESKESERRKREIRAIGGGINSDIQFNDAFPARLEYLYTDRWRVTTADPFSMWL